MPPAKPSHTLVRSLTDEQVVRALMREPRLTRAQLAARTGISKPTASESVRRLSEAGLVRDTGERTTGRGRVGSYFGLATGLGAGLAVSIASEGIVAEAVDVHGRVVARHARQVRRPARPAQVTRALRATAERVEAGCLEPIRLAVVSAADPVDRSSGRLVHLPDSPFLIGELSPAHALAALVGGPVEVDNDVHWAARAERRAAGPGELDDFVYVYLGEGLGAAVVSDGEVRRGHGGIAGEVAHVLTRGPRGRALPFTQVFAELGLRRASSSAVDSAAVVAAVERGDARAGRVRVAVAEAVAGVLTAVVALTDPELVVVGGPWGAHPAMLESIAGQLAGSPRHVPLRAARVTDEPSLAGARQRAVQAVRHSVLARLR